MPSPHIFEIRRLLDQSERRAAAGDLDGARQAVLEALQLSPDDVDLLCALGRLELRRGDLPAARDGYERSLAIDSRHPQTRYDLAFVRIEERRFSDAEALLAGLVKDVPDSVEAITELAFLYRATGRLRKALELYRQALDLAPDSPDVLVPYAVALRDWGDHGAALAYLQDARRGLDDEEEAEATGETIDTLLGELQFPEGIGPKEELYLRHGSILLGTSSDNGIDVPNYFFYHFGADELAVTIARLVALAKGLGWSPAYVCEVDPDGAPLAICISEALGVPRIAGPEEAAPGGDGPAVLLIEASGDAEGEARSAEIEAWCAIGASPIAVTFALVTGGESVEDPPDIVGVTVSVEGTFPWHRDGCTQFGTKNPHGSILKALDPIMDERPTAEIASEVSAQLAELLPEQNLAEQVRFYALEHRELRLHLQPGRGPVIDLGPLVEQLPARAAVAEALASGDPRRMAAGLARLAGADGLRDGELEALLDLRAVPGARERVHPILSEHAADRYMEELERAVREPVEADDRRDAMRLLLALDAPASEDFLAECLMGPDEDLRFWTVGPGGFGALPLLEAHPDIDAIVRSLLGAGGRVAVATLGWLTAGGEPRFASEARQLLQASDEDVLHSALSYLAASGARVPTGALRQLLRHPEPEVVRAACAVAKGAAPFRLRGPLARLVMRGEAAVAGDALEALLAIAPRTARRAARSRLVSEGDRPDVVSALCDALVVAGDPAASVLLADLLSSARWQPTEDQIPGAISAMASSGDFRVLPTVRALLAEVGTPPTAGIDYIETYGDADDEALLASLLAGQHEVQQRVAAALCRLGLMRYMEILRDGLDCPSPDRVAAACEAIAHVDGSLATGLLLAQLDREEAASGTISGLETWVRRRTLKGRLAALDEDSRAQIGEFLERTLLHGAPELRGRTLALIAAIDPTRGAPALEDFLDPEADRDLLVDVLDHCRTCPTPERRQAAAVLLGHHSLRVRSLARLLQAEDI